MKRTARNNMMSNISAAFEIEVLCRMFSKGFLVDIEPKIDQFGEMNIMEAKHEQESDAPENDHKINATIWR